MNFRIKHWWLPVLIVFDFIYYYFIQHLTTPSVNRFFAPIRIDGFIFVCIISLISVGCVRWVKRRINRLSASKIPVKYLKILFYSFLLFILLVSTIQFLLEYASGQQRNIEYVIGNGLTYVFLHIVVGNAYIAMEYFRESAALQQHLVLSEKAKTESELRVLQQQMSPHFLFNNLNTLASLIVQDEQKAVKFTYSLSNILRYVSKNARKDLISLSEEFSFLDQYLELMKFRFGDAYQVEVENGVFDTDRFLVVPLALQVLMENVIKHNSGSRTNPLEIKIRVSGQTLFVSNEIREKRGVPEEQSGIGLNNLKERYRLLTGEHIQFGEKDGRFEVILPLIKHLDDADISN